MLSLNRNQRGFTLVEIAIVLLVVTILLGYSVAMYPVQQELKQYRSAARQMDDIVAQLVAFAQVNGRLPCPDTITDNEAPANAAYDGLEDLLNDPNDGCEAYFGFLPGRTLGMNGSYNALGQLVDPWDTGYAYAVSDIDFSGTGTPDLVTVNGVREEGMANVQPDLFICDDSNATGFDLTCADVSGNDVLGINGEVAAVIISLGKDSVIPATSNIQDENQDDFDGGTADKVYIFSARRDDYDDIVKWIPTNLLFSKMIEAEQLP